MDFRLTTFNLLAPCYKRMHSETPPIADTATGLLAHQKRARAKRTARESEFDHVWRERAFETVRQAVPLPFAGCDAGGLRFFRGLPFRRCYAPIFFMVGRLLIGARGLWWIAVVCLCVLPYCCGRKPRPPCTGILYEVLDVHRVMPTRAGLLENFAAYCCTLYLQQ